MAMTGEQLAAAAADHLWLHFRRLPDEAAPLTVIERGEGSYVWDVDGARYLDGLAGLFVVQVGHGRQQIADAAGAQAAKLGYYPTWNFAHPTAIELATRLAGLAPGDLNRVFFTSGGSEAVESAWKLARQYFLAVGQPDRVKVIARHTAYHGTTLGALSITGLEPIRQPFLPLLNGQVRHVPNTVSAQRGDPSDALAGADAIEEAIIAEGPGTVAAVYLEPVQNAGGCMVPPPGYFERVRQICVRHGVLLVSDEVICAFGRLGAWFGCQRLGYQPDMITFAKGVTSGYSPLGGVMVSDRIAEPFLAQGTTFQHGITFAGHPVSCAVALANLDVMEAEGLCARVQELEPAFRSALETLTDLPIVSEVRGMGYFYAVALTGPYHDLTADEREWLVRRFLPPRMLELGLICRADDRGEAVIQLSPPLVASEAEIESISAVLHQVLREAGKELGA